MFVDPLPITYNGATKNLVRTNNDNGGSDYYLDGGTEKFSLQIRHTIPPRGGAGESHMIRLDVDHHDANGVYIRRTSAWTVSKTFDNTQDTTKLSYALAGLLSSLTAGNQTKLLAREN